MTHALIFLGGFLLFVAVTSVLLPVAIVLLIDRIWGYEPDALEAAYGVPSLAGKRPDVIARRILGPLSDCGSNERS